jgi:hypothetical protein
MFDCSDNKYNFWDIFAEPSAEKCSFQPTHVRSSAVSAQNPPDCIMLTLTSEHQVASALRKVITLFQ